MAKLILLSVVLMSMVIPIRLCTKPSPRKALKRAQYTMLAFIVLWAVLCTFWYPALVPLE